MKACSEPRRKATEKVALTGKKVAFICKPL
jgi:hypothetical protein